MKNAMKNTGWVLIKAHTNSEWDSCEFAIIQVTGDWKKEQAKRLAIGQPFSGDYYFQSLNYYDATVNFFITDEEDLPDLDTLLADKGWTYVALDENELEQLPVPESSLDSYTMVIYADGTACHKAYGKHTGEEFWTESFPLNQLKAV